ncbi:MAG: hypothetical protein K2N47_01185 [Clostridia bacterium]|nr:hypothetical protein [Clostridia bacterium]
MEEICKLLSERLREADGKYTVFYEDDLLDEIPEDMRNRDTLEAVLKKLHTEGCIEVKYARGNAFCIAYKKPFETDEGDKNTTVETTPALTAERADKKQYLYVFLSAFFGGLLSGGICALIGAVV